MRTNKLRRWLLRGALISATAVGAFTAAQPAQADIIWQKIPDSASVTEPNDDAQIARIESEIIWQ